MENRDYRVLLEIEEKISRRLREYAKDLEELVHEQAKEKIAYMRKISELEGQLRKQ